jgi:mannose-6-phosphate isomerase-like protein (cupin superfamily)
LTWDETHSEEAIYVVAGAIEVNGGVCETGGAVVLEAGSTPYVRARSDVTIVHVGTDPKQFRSAPIRATTRKSHVGVHLIGADGLEPGAGEAGSDVWYFANGKCPTCRIMFYRVTGHGNTRSHYHTQPQLQYVLNGTIRIGRDVVSPGMTFAIPTNHRYGFTAAGPWELLVHRPELSTMRRRENEPMIPEGGSFVGTPPWAPEKIAT